MLKTVSWLGGVAALCLVGWLTYSFVIVPLASVEIAPSSGPGSRPAIVPPAGAPAVLDKLNRVAGNPAAPEIGFVDADGKPVTLADFRGRYVLINLWATWCGPCIVELPALARLQAQLPQDRMTVVPVDVLEKLDAAKLGDFLKMRNAEGLPVYIDREFKTQRGFRANELPLTILVDAEGREVARAAGGQEWDHPEAVAYFKALSAPKPAQ